MPTIDTLIIGAGQAGLASSAHLSRAGVDHLVLERGEIGNSWVHERWDSLSLLSPNWHSRLPDYAYSGDDPDGYMSALETASFLGDYAKSTSAPIQTNTPVRKLHHSDNRFFVETDAGPVQAKSVILTTGACNKANVPPDYQDMSGDNILSISPIGYKNPAQIPSGKVLIVGASASGIQIAHELASAGREVTVAVGKHIRSPRVWRGKDIIFWLDQAGFFDTKIEDMSDPDQARRMPSIQLAGTPSRKTFDLNALQDLGVELTGRLAKIENGIAHFEDRLEETVKTADTSMQDMLTKIDDFIDRNEQGDFERNHAEQIPEATQLKSPPRNVIDLKKEDYSSIVWATGYKPEMDWVSLPVFDNRTNRIMHDKGVTPIPGLYVLGLPFLSKRKSNFIDGVGEDSGFVVNRAVSFLNELNHK